MAGKKDISNEDKKAIAYDLYMNTDLSQKEICGKVAITQATFTAWKKKHNWEIHKQASSITSQQIIRNLYKKGLELSNDPKATSDSQLKNAKAIELLSGNKASISNIINVFKEFTTFEFDRNPELAKQINKEMKVWVDHKINGE
ncbi:hypothetical protein QWY81_17860 [Polaribacter undariae]|uniref:Uncharacterized protein n=1 Tax=Polaribacter sejongensis TaxID=985043 RepID=A0AAJ1QZQ1_9FLAO|nr:hypothetical protein [Polaribacter undariae]MDN3621338.1 hypothetical protein [Polaribacter undariae]UWD31880.1 hypothetical protein NQP51_17325 [Polaribacter undariae]